MLAEKRPLWQIVAGSALAGLTVMTRQNLFLLIPLLIAYVFWQHGKTAGWWSLVGCLFPVLLVHAIYWPNILQLWAVWLPAAWTPFLNAYRFPAAPLVSPNLLSFPASSLALLQGFRFHYFTLVGFFVCAFLWPRRGGWKDRADQRAAYFLGALFLVLALLHAWATISTSDQAATCTFCFTPYLSFFDLAALLLIVVTFPSWRRTLSKVVQGIIVFFILLLSVSLGYAGFDRFGPWLLGIEFPALTRGLDPHKWVPFITLSDILSNKFHLDYWTNRVPVSIIAAVILGIVFLTLGRLAYKRWLNQERMAAYSFGTFILAALLGSGVLLSPLMGGTYRQDGICQADIPQAYAQVGKSLARIIPAGSQVYWESFTVLPLLYTPGISIYTPQIYQMFSFRIGGEAGQLAKYGLWNDELARQWKAEARFIVTDANSGLSYHPGGDLDTTQFDSYRTAQANPCDPNSYLIVYERKP